MPNTFAGSRFYARLGNVFTRPMWSLLATPEGFAILTTTGRKTGLTRRQSIRAIRRGDIVVAVAMMGERAQWLRNVRANQGVTLKLNDGTHRGVAHEATAASETEQANDIYVNSTVSHDYVDYAVYEWGFPTRDNVRKAHQKWFDAGIPVIIQLNESAEA